MAVPTSWLLPILTIVYFGAGKLGLSFATVNSSASAVWPGTGIALAAFLIYGMRAWPAIFVGAFLVNITTAGSFTTSLGIAFGNTLEGIAGAWLVQRYAGGAECFERARDVFKFAALAAVVATTIAACIGVVSLALAGFARWEQFDAIWLTWWLGDAVGALIVTPLVVLWHHSPRAVSPRGQFLVALPMLLAAATITVIVFVAPGVRDYPLAFLCLPALAWIAFRYGPREAATAIALVLVVAVVATETGFGPFVMDSRNESLLVLQAFMGMVALTLLPMAALVGEHRMAVAEAQAAVRSREVFLAMLGHELRNPLQAISNALHLVEHAGANRALSERSIAIARRQSEHLARILNDLLDVARVVSGKMGLERRAVRLDAAVRHGMELISGRLEARTITTDLEPVAVDADKMRLEQIVDNLLGNALKYTAPDGMIRIAVREEAGNAVLRVRDDGVGIPAELLPRVFDLFTQGEVQLDRREGGLGIGLTLVRTLAELHGGSAEAYSGGSGKGCEIVVRFPLARASAEDVIPGAAASAAAMARDPMTRRHVLTIEDNSAVRESLRAVLTAEGYEVHEAADGEEGIEAAERVRPDVVLIDIGLPRIDGYEVARRLRGRQAALGVRWRLIALTGYGQAEDVRRAMEAGFDAHVVKPISPRELQAAMHRGEAFA